MSGKGEEKIAYIIENANVLKDKTLKKYSMLIQDERIAAIQPQFKYYRLMKMNVDPFILTPTFVLLNSKVSTISAFPELKQYLTEVFLLKGCTTLITYVNVLYERELSEKITALKMSLNSSPVDFAICVKIPVGLLTDSFVRKCKQEKIPAIFVELEDTNELQKIPWAWIKNSLFPYNCPLIPIISIAHKKEKKAILSKWKDIIIKENLAAVYEELEENKPLPITILNKIGIFPSKGSLMFGSELSYNLFYLDNEIKNIDEDHLFHYHSDRLVVTVHKGRIVRLEKTVLFKPGFGEHVKVRTPAFFSL
ncbi:hypothetical protein HPT25_24905 [Bacillus sp. BRMEA1]|uniref:hypothetical protein n=1 Tax=Neobacillus endophyticus TaxID=2738405 RepID=UPI001566A358|nr:hypothetical protein [Neobacillus endophyticus]NRD80567.1 hypothetical protein [Neobacillus endophyticus]